MGIIKKYAKKARRAVQNRYIKKKTGYKGLKYGNITNDIASAVKMARLLNVEKKRIASSVVTTNWAATSGAGTGAQILNLFAPITFAQGTTATTINGQSIKITSLKFRYRLTQQSALVSAFRYKIVFFECANATIPPLNGTTLAQIYNADPITTYIDYNSERNPDYLQTYKQIHSFSSLMPADNYAGIANYESGHRWIYGGKKTRHIRFDSSLNILNNNVIIVFLGDIGDTPSNTGMTCQHYLQLYFVDN